MKNDLKVGALPSKKNIIIYVVTVFISAVLLFVGHKVAYDKSTMFLGGYDDGACSAVVTEIVEVITEDITIDSALAGQDKTVVFKCLVKSGELKGKTVTAVETISVYDMVPLEEVMVGSRILIAENPDDSSEWDFYMHDYNRLTPIWILGGMFVVLILVFGKMKGVNTLISLGFTCIAVFAVFVPAVLSAKNIYLWAIITCVYIIAMTLTITNGYSKKTLAAVIGCSSGVIVSGLLTLIFRSYMNLSGITSEDSMYIKDFNVDLHALIFAGVILGSVGAVMDVSVSISSSLKELHDQIENPTFLKLVRSGITIGRDIMGTMANTLVLAYIGCELGGTLLSVVYSSSLTTLFSREKIVEELLQAFVGSIGILLTIPLTAVVSSALYMGKQFKIKKFDKYYVEPADEPSLFEKKNIK